MKTPKTYFSTEFQGGQRALRGRLKNLMAAAPRRRGMVALALLLVAVVLGGACLVFLPAAQGEKESSHSDPLAAIQVVYGVSDAEYTLRRNGYPGYYGLGGSGIEFLSGEPSQSQIVDTNGDAIYGVGDYWEETRWDGLTILCYVNVEYAAGPQINKLSTTRSDVSTYRGISVGATREEVLSAYPGAIADSSWGGWEGDFLRWQNVPEGAEMSGLGQNLIFYFEDDTVTRMELIDMFD